jgi:putative ABC transport system substrate-binding protein
MNAAEYGVTPARIFASIQMVLNLALKARRDGVAAFHAGLRETGYREGQDVAFEYRWAEEQYDRLPSLAADLVRRQVAVIVAAGATPALAAKAATTTIPIVFGTGGDPVSRGLVSSLNRPGGNLTGVSTLINAIGSKQLQMLHELAPRAKAIAHLVNPANPNAQSDAKDVQSAAGTLRLQVNILNASIPSDIDLAFATIAQQQFSGVLVANDPFLNSRFNQIAQLTLAHRVPAVLPHREAVTVGGLISYGPSRRIERSLGNRAFTRVLRGRVGSRRGRVASVMKRPARNAGGSRGREWQRDLSYKPLARGGGVGFLRCVCWPRICCDACGSCDFGCVAGASFNLFQTHRTRW